jgi:hypothetical protein
LQKESPPNYIPMYEMGSTLSGNPGIPPNYIYEGEYVNFHGTGEEMVLGRITVRTNNEVRDFIDKLFGYEVKNIDGIWNKRIILAGDDEFKNPNVWEGPGMHSGACERLIPYIPDSLYDLVKIYMVSYPPFSYPTTKPKAQKAFIKELNKGAYAGVFFGHGNTNQLAHEGLFYHTSIPQVKNSRKYFFFYFASCTVGRFNDSDYECIAEQFVRIKEGAIGTMGATAGTSPGNNEAIGRELFRLLTDPDTILTMGECHLFAKSISFGSHYLLLGDPATKLRKVRKRMVLSASPDSLRPVEKLKITADENQYYLKAFVRDSDSIPFFDESTADKISGHVYREVQIGEGNPPPTVPFHYLIDGKEIYLGYWDYDTATIFAPNIVTTHLPVIKLTCFVDKTSGLLDSIRVFGNAVPSSDVLGPEIILYDGGRKLKDDDWVDKEFVLTGKVSDESGVNLLNSVESTRGFYLYINQDIENKVDLRDYFQYERDSYTSGEFNVQLSLPKSIDTITINVTDNRWNQSTKTIALNAEVYNDVTIDNFLVYPNPLKEQSDIWFTFYLTRSGLVDLKIFTIAGRLIKTIDNIFSRSGYNQVYWDLLDEYHDEISNGVYLVKATVSAEGSHDEVTEKFIIAR